jgi:hypothetical protein
MEATAVRMDVTLAELYEDVGFSSPYAALRHHKSGTNSHQEANTDATATGRSGESSESGGLNRGIEMVCQKAVGAGIALY